MTITALVTAAAPKLPPALSDADDTQLVIC
jgi:hypothetical protein